MPAYMASAAATDTIPTGDFEGAIKIGNRGAHIIYWHPQTNAMVHLKKDEIQTGVTDMITHLRNPVGDYLNESDRSGQAWEFSKAGEFFRNASTFKGTRILTYREEMVYVISRYTSYTDEEGASMLGISTSVYKNHLKKAQEKVACAFNLVEAAVQ